MSKFYPRLSKVFIFLFLLLFSQFLNAQITTVAGRPYYLGDAGNALNAGLATPYSYAVDASGNIYIACVNDNRVRKIDASTFIITTIAGTGAAGYNGDNIAATDAKLNFKNGFPGTAVDKSGNVYISDYKNNRIRKIDAVTKLITTIVNTSGTGGYSGDNGLAASAKISGPAGIWIDDNGNIYFADNNNSRIRRVDVTTKIITTIAGNGIADFSGDDGAPISASLNYPEKFAFDSKGVLYIADVYNSRVRQVKNNVITTIAGNGSPTNDGDGGLATDASIGLPTGIAIDTDDNIYIVDNYNSVVRRIDAKTKKISTVAGDGYPDYYGDGGVATNAELNNPTDILIDKLNNIYIVDKDNNRIRKVDANTNIITTFIGDGTDGFNSTPDALKAQLNPLAIASFGKDLFIAEGTYYDVRQIDVNNNTYPVAGNPNIDPAYASKGFAGDNGLATQAKLNAPVDVKTDADGNIYIADVFNNRIRKVDKNTNIITTIAGAGTAGFSGDNGLATAAQLNAPYGIALDKNGNLYIADAQNNRIRKITTSTGKISTIAGTGSATSGADGSVATSTSLNYPYSIAVDASLNVYILEKGVGKVRKIDASTQKISTVLSNNHVLTAIALDQKQNILVSDSTDNKVLRIDKASLNVYGIAGNGTPGYSGDGGDASLAQLNGPRGLYADNLGYIYIADAGNHVIRKFSPGTLPVLLSSFIVNLKGTDALMQWKTATEENSGYFNIQRSIDGIRFTTIAKQTASGHSSLPVNYAYTDVNIASINASKVYYRLQEVDKDGKAAYSNIVILVLNKPSVAINVYPNPATDFIIVKGITNGKAVLQITNMLGEIVIQETLNNFVQRINISGLTKGAYFVTVFTNDHKQTEKIVVE